jgi:hypothetical protein
MTALSQYSSKHVRLTGHTCDPTVSCTLTSNDYSTVVSMLYPVYHCARYSIAVDVLSSSAANKSTAMTTMNVLDRVLYTASSKLTSILYTRTEEN